MTKIIPSNENTQLITTSSLTIWSCAVHHLKIQQASARHLALLMRQSTYRLKCELSISYRVARCATARYHASSTLHTLWLGRRRLFNRLQRTMARFCHGMVSSWQRIPRLQYGPDALSRFELVKSLYLWRDKCLQLLCR